jgi:hypothetical protein
MLRALRSVGITPDMFYVASLASMLLSLVLWFVPRGGDDADKGRPERLAIFVGLWPPTLFLIGHALRAEAAPQGAAELDAGPSDLTLTDGD